MELSVRRLTHSAVMFVLLSWGVLPGNVSVNDSLPIGLAEATQSSAFHTTAMTSSSGQKLIYRCNDDSCITEENKRVRVDLGNVYKISSVVIHRKTPANGCHVELSKTGDASQCVQGTLDDEGRRCYIESTEDILLPDSRYITLKSQTKRQISDIEVFGDCPNNYCGTNCTEFCFCKTPLTRAEKETLQTCTGGCREGWHGDRCNKKKCEDKWFGLHCRYRSHCLDQCDPWTGECIGRDKCYANWYGPSCQKANEEVLVKDEDFVSDKAVTTCGFIWQKTLTFNVPTKVSIVDVILHIKQGILSHRDVTLKLTPRSGRPKEATEVTRRRLGCEDKLQLVFLANESIITNPNESEISSLLIKVAKEDIDICEVKFSGCSVGTFGPDCNSRCHCLNQSSCNTIDGACPEAGCEIGWGGKACDTKCSHGTYGEQCKGRCHCLNDEPCDPVTGTCPSGCSDGWTRHSCSEPCSAGKFGKNCDYGCRHCANNEMCDHINGSCYSGCQQGWHGPRCGLEDFHDTDDPNHDHGTDVHVPDDSEYLLEPDIIADTSTAESDNANNNCTECGAGLKVNPDQSSNDMLVAYGILGASMTILIILTTVAVVCAVRRRRDRRSKAVYSYVSNRDIVVEMEAPSRTETPGSGQVHVVEAQIEEVVDLVDMEADVLDDAVLKIYDDDFVLDTDPNGPLPVAKLWARILELRDDDEMLLKEFASLPIGICDSVDDATIPENKKKNRYNGVYPYDFNRVKLKRNEVDPSSSNSHLYDNVPSDFINASYFNGFGRQKAYIVTQGPLEWTRGDFWEMIWHEGTAQIVMLTNLIEDRKIKCSQYWPAEGKAHFGKISIKHISSTTLPNFTVTQLQIKVGKDSEPHIVRHYHYETWPDKNIPDSAWNLVDFWRHVRASKQESDGPLVVHCSAGVGRSGTYIGLDYLYDQAVARGSVKVFDCVRTMRKYRLNMVQTKLQYLYLHEVVAEAVHCGSLPIDQQVFQDYTEELQKIDPRTGTTNMQIQYENLCEGIALSLSEEQDQIYANNRSVHVQALYLKNHEGEDRYLVEQSCYIGEDEDFWRNVYTIQSATVVTFENGELSWLENDNSKQIGEVELTQTSEELVQSDDKMKDLFIRRTLSIQLQDAVPHEVHMFEPLFWNGEQADCRAQEMLCFIDYVIEWQKHRSGTKNIVLQYGDDPSSLGPFLVISDELDRLTNTNKIGIYEVVWRFKSVFPNMIPDFKQYSLCYTALAEKQKASTTYYNM